MAVLNIDLFEKLIGKSETSLILTKTVVTEGGCLEDFWRICEAKTSFYFSSNLLPSSCQNEAKFFVCADYLTQIPYGLAGYDAFEQMLKTSGCELSVSQYRFNKLKNIMGEDLTSLPQEQIDYIKSYFDNYNKKEINLKKTIEVVPLICRVHHEYEALLKKNYNNWMEISEELNPFKYDLANLFSKQETVVANGFLNNIPKQKQLGDDEILFIKSIMNYDA